MMEKISNAGNGNYAVITSEEYADEYLEERLLSNLMLIAKDMKIQVEFNPAQIAEYRLIGYETRALRREDFNNDAVDAGDLDGARKAGGTLMMVIQNTIYLILKLL